MVDEDLWTTTSHVSHLRHGFIRKIEKMPQHLQGHVYPTPRMTRMDASSTMCPPSYELRSRGGMPNRLKTLAGAMIPEDNVDDGVQKMRFLASLFHFKQKLLT